MDGGAGAGPDTWPAGNNVATTSENALPNRPECVVIDSLLMQGTSTKIGAV